MKTALFLATFAVYVFTAFPALAPYRDAGEMTSAAATLGVAHPPGYPLYILAAKVAGIALPFGNYARRISALSALFMAGAVALFFEITRKRLGANASLAAALSLCFGFSYLYWYLALVQEMYTMSVFLILFAAFLLLTGREPAATAAAFFILGTSAGARTDAALIYPAFLIYAVGNRADKRTLAAAHAALAAGLCIFFYSIIRAAGGPAINWGDPSSPERLAASLLRRSHGGTLDLVSRGFAAGENFLSQMKFYFAHVFRDFFYAGIIAAAAGAWALLRKDRNFFRFAAAGWLVAGALFIYLANMPPNPHAMAILEAHFLLPDLFFCFFAAAGAVYLSSKRMAAEIGVWAVAAGVFLSSYAGVDKRGNFFMTDYTRNVLSSVGDGAVVAKEDVQVFSLWHARYVLGKRPEVVAVAAGLAGSPWHRAMNKNAGVALAPLADEAGWKFFISANKKVFFTNDAEYPLGAGTASPLGLVNFVGKTAEWPGRLLDSIYVYRGNYRYDSHREFFTPDLIEDYAKAWHQRGFRLMTSGDTDGAKDAFLVSLYMKEDWPLGAYHLGWCRFLKNDFTGALRYYEYATTMYDKYMALARRYRASEDASGAIKKEAAAAWLHRGVSSEKLGRDDDALACYGRSAQIAPDSALAYYNKAVIFWKRKNFEAAAENLRLTLRYDPGNEAARKYLAILEGK